MTNAQDNKMDLSMVMMKARHVPSSHKDFGVLDIEFDNSAHWVLSNNTSSSTVTLYLDSKEQAEEIIRLANRMLDAGEKS